MLYLQLEVSRDFSHNSLVAYNRLYLWNPCMSREQLCSAVHQLQDGAAKQGGSKNELGLYAPRSVRVWVEQLVKTGLCRPTRMILHCVFRYIQSQELLRSRLYIHCIVGG